MKSIIFRYFPVLAVIALLISCSDNTTIPVGGNSIRGNITFADTHFVTSGGEYAIALFPNEYPPFFSLPVKTEPLVMQSINVSSYTISWDGDRKFFLGVVWKGDSTNPNPPIIVGVYGCDTSHSCWPTKMAYFPNVPEVTYNILSWADTAKRIY